MTSDVSIHDLFYEIDRIIEDRDLVNRIERGVRETEREEGEVAQTVEIYVLEKSKARQAELMGELEKVAILSRDEAQRLGFETSRIRTARDRPACRQFDLE